MWTRVWSRRSLVLGELLKTDYDLFVATNGTAAVEMAIANPPDLILLDIIMPDTDGYEVCRKLKENDPTGKIPIIFITAKRLGKDEVRGLARVYNVHAMERTGLK